MTVVDATGSLIVRQRQAPTRIGDDLTPVLHGLIPGIPGNTVDINLRSEEA